jgi:hypothetical protein
LGPFPWLVLVAAVPQLVLVAPLPWPDPLIWPDPSPADASTLLCCRKATDVTLGGAGLGMFLPRLPAVEGAAGACAACNQATANQLRFDRELHDDIMRG